MSKQKIKLMTDSACDIPKETERELDIRIMCFPVVIDGKSYRERESFTNEEFYRLMDEAAEIPTTAQITSFEFEEAFAQYAGEGYTHIIVVTISSTGSNTHNAAVMARDAYFEAHPEVRERLSIYVLDSLNYTGVYGYPVTEAAKMARRGVEAEEIVSYLQDWFASVEVWFAPYTLKYVKKSGRVSCAAAFVGEVLGLRPVIRIMDGVAETMDKVRGEKSIIPKLAERAAGSMVPKTPYIVIAGSAPGLAKELSEVLTKKLGYPPADVCQIGAAISVNAGHWLTGVIVKGPKRRG